MRKSVFISLLKESFNQWRHHKISNLAASLSFYMTFALGPVLIICIAVAGLLIGKDLAQQQVFSEIDLAFGHDTADLIKNIIISADKPFHGIVATLTGIAVLLFSAGGVFSQLQDGIDTIWEVQPKANRTIIDIIHDRFFSFVMILGVAFLLLVSLVINTIIISLSQYLNEIIFSGTYIWTFVNLVISIGVITILFALIFKILPDAVIAWNDVWLGAFVTSILFNVGKLILEVYLAKANINSLYGSAGSFVVILLWIYYSSQILFFGVEFTKVKTLRRKTLKPAENAVRARS